MARIIVNQDFLYEMQMVSALLMEQINSAIVTTNQLLSQIDSIGLSTCDLGELTYRGLSDVGQDLQRAISHAELVQASVKEMEQKLQGLIAAPPKNRTDAFRTCPHRIKICVREYEDEK